MMFQIYTDTSDSTRGIKEYRWRLIKKAGEIPIAYGAKGFANKADCEHNIHAVMLADYATPVVELDKNPNNEYFNSLVNYINA